MGAGGSFASPYQLFIRKSSGIRTESWIRLTPDGGRRLIRIPVSVIYQKIPWDTDKILDSTDTEWGPEAHSHPRISYLSENPLGTWTESLIRLTLDGSRGPFVPPYQLFIRKSPGIRTESWIRLTPNGGRRLIRIPVSVIYQKIPWDTDRILDSTDTGWGPEAHSFPVCQSFIRKSPGIRTES